MQRTKAKVFFWALLVLTVLSIGMNLVMFDNTQLLLEESNSFVDAWGLASGVLMFLCLYAYAYHKVVFKSRVVLKFVFLNTAAVGVFSFVDSLWTDYELMSGMEVLVMILLYFAVYFPSLSILHKHQDDVTN
ncbi:hypothetical protein [Photobacterium galatheae]|uniref:Uncharacterized protein n=1 Tax=Photobacterium galatheae TaxID=1654360 RepID=A0A066RRP0_9GAMM|nr:hypothetical protein [Photobacterium galatheae]KDM91766.1 hypothetical protein EA58_09650 [Photobacterium galatheae]MCM0147141.1 hypothetical protein [Photobacterium galatheae]